MKCRAIAERSEKNNQVGEKDAMKIYSAMFGMSQEELLEKIRKTPGHEWVNAYLTIETPSSRAEYDSDKFSVGIYMDELETWYDGYKEDEIFYFPDPQIDYSDICRNMNDDNGHADFNIDMFTDALSFMVDYETDPRRTRNLDEGERYFGIYTQGCMEYLKVIGFDEMKDIVNSLKETKDIGAFLQNVGLGDASLEIEDPSLDR